MISYNTSDIVPPNPVSPEYILPYFKLIKDGIEYQPFIYWNKDWWKCVLHNFENASMWWQVVWKDILELQNKVKEIIQKEKADYDIELFFQTP